VCVCVCACVCVCVCVCACVSDASGVSWECQGVVSSPSLLWAIIVLFIYHCASVLWCRIQMRQPIIVVSRPCMLKFKVLLLTNTASLHLIAFNNAFYPCFPQPVSDLICWSSTLSWAPQQHLGIRELHFFHTCMCVSAISMTRTNECLFEEIKPFLPSFKVHCARDCHPDIYMYLLP